MEPTAFYVEEHTFYVEPTMHSSTLSAPYVEDEPFYVEQCALFSTYTPYSSTHSSQSATYNLFYVAR